MYEDAVDGFQFAGWTDKSLAFTVPRFFTYTTTTFLAPGYIVPQFIDVILCLHELSEYNPKFNDAVTLGVLELMTKPEALGILTLEETPL